MKDERKTKKQLIGELDTLRQRHTQLETDSEGVAAALRESEASMKGIVKAAPIGIGLVHNRVLGWLSDHMNEMLGYSGQELIGQSARVLYESDDEFERVGSEKYQEIRERGVGAIETRWKRKDGRLIDVHLRSTPVDPTDLAQGVLFTALDVTESRYAQRALSESEKRYRRITEAITDYIFTVKVADGHPAETHHGPTCEAVTGYTAEEFNADSFRLRKLCRDMTRNR
jgi:PAS domain S-box-containing protein